MSRNLPSRHLPRAVAPTALLAAVAVLTLAAAGCNGWNDPSSPGPDVVRIVGTLTDEGVECPAMRGDDGELYTLGPRELIRGEVGDRVRVTGRLAEASICMQGTTLIVESFEVL